MNKGYVFQNGVKAIITVIMIFAAMFPVKVFADTVFGHPVQNPYQNPNCMYNVLTCANSTRYHTGVDYSGNSSTDIIASNYGTIARLEYMSSNDHGMGNNVIIEHDLGGNKIYTSYSHLSSIESSLYQGKTVNKGEKIGIMGGSGYGRSNYWGVHLHFEVKDSAVTNNPSGGGPYWGYTPGNPDNYGYHNPNSYVGIVSLNRLTVYDFWKKADPIYAASSSDIWHPNFDAQYKIRNDGSEAITIQRLALAVHYSDNRFCLDMSNPSTGEARYYDDLVLYPGQSQNFDFSVAYFRTSGNYKVVAKAQTADGVWNELASMDFVVQPETQQQCTTGSILMNQTASGSWTSSCASTHRTGRYAQYYTFILSSSQTVRIFLQSSQDTYLYLLNGNGTGGSVIASDDDGGGGTNSLIQRSLSAGTYTVEATTYRSGTTGSFTLSVNGGTSEICGNRIDDDGDGRTDCDDSDCSSDPTCQGRCTVSSISMNQTVNGSWTSSCVSTHKSGSYAQFYTFTLSSSQTVRIFLQSSQDTYLYLLNGNGTGGSVIASDDDGGGGTNSLIQRSLSAGTYTVEATTYSSGTTGSFTLSVTGGMQEVCNDGIDNDGDGRIDCNDSDCSSDTSCQTPSCNVGSISRGSSVSSSWTSSCASTHRTGSYAKYYTFSVPSGTSIQIDLESSADTYLYVLSGNGMNGSVVSEDDDSGSSTNSRISGTANCSTCTFTIEATTYDRGTTGSFTLRLQ